MRQLVALTLSFGLCSGNAVAGLHYSGEVVADLPSQWRGYLLDHRALRVLAVPPAPGMPSSPLRDRYLAERTKLEALTRPLTADEAADLGALHVRLGAAEKAMDLLRTACRAYPKDFRCAANLGTASQIFGDMNQAVAALELAVSLAPEKWKKAEQLHLNLVRTRRTEAKNTVTLDNLFGVPFDAEKPPPKLPADALSLVQLLGLWLPADGRLLWQLGELAGATGDLSTSAAILDGCVTEFGIGDPDLRKRRVAYRTLAGAPPAPAGKNGAANAHAGHANAGTIRFRSTRPLVRTAEPLLLPEIRANGLNMLPWMVLAETSLDKPFRVAFHSHLRKLDGKRVVLSGYMQPTGDDLDQAWVMLLEYPVGCWFCEVPEPTGIVCVLPPSGKAIRLTREAVRIEGRLELNDKDPEEFLYMIRDARVGPIE